MSERDAIAEVESGECDERIARILCDVWGYVWDGDPDADENVIPERSGADYDRPDKVTFIAGAVAIRSQVLKPLIAALRAQDRAEGAGEMRAPKLRTPLTDAEREFITEMSHEDDGRTDRWQNFDPDFRQKDIARLLRLGWAERRERDGYREYRWTAAGRLALAEQEKGG